MQVCPQCQSDRLVKNGFAAGKPKRLCRQCGYQFTRPTPRGKPLAMKVHAALLSLSGISMNRIAFLLRVSAQSVLNWIRAFATEHYKKPEPAGKTRMVKISELGQVQPPRPAIAVNVKQKLKQPIGDRFGIQLISQNTLVIGQREDGETCRRVVWFCRKVAFSGILSSVSH